MCFVHATPVRPLRALARLLRVAADDLDFVGLYRLGTVVVHFKCDIFDQECPHLVAESVRVETSLQKERGDQKLDPNEPWVASFRPPGNVLALSHLE